MSVERNQKFHNAYITADKYELQRLWEEESPPSLTKFFPATYASNGTNYFLDHLENKTLWLSSPEFFNDPLDCVYNFDYYGEARQLAEAVIKDLPVDDSMKQLLNSARFQESFTDLVGRYQSTLLKTHSRLEHSQYVSCFSEVENIYSKRMWAHYDNAHKGVCAEYEFDSVNQICTVGCIPVIYTDAYNRTPQTETTHDEVAELLKLVYNKAMEWKYEKEWRVVQQSEDVKNGLTLPCPLPKKIYLGCKVEKKLKLDVLTFCAGTEIEVFQMKLIPGSFNLGFEQYIFPKM